MSSIKLIYIQTFFVADFWRNFFDDMIAVNLIFFLLQN